MFQIIPTTRTYVQTGSTTVLATYCGCHYRGEARCKCVPKIAVLICDLRHLGLGYILTLRSDIESQKLTDITGVPSPYDEFLVGAASLYIAPGPATEAPPPSRTGAAPSEHMNPCSIAHESFKHSYLRFEPDETGMDSSLPVDIPSLTDEIAGIFEGFDDAAVARPVRYSRMMGHLLNLIIAHTAGPRLIVPVLSVLDELAAIRGAPLDIELSTLVSSEHTPE